MNCKTCGLPKDDGILRCPDCGCNKFRLVGTDTYVCLDCRAELKIRNATATGATHRLEIVKVNAGGSI